MNKTIFTLLFVFVAGLNVNAQDSLSTSNPIQQEFNELIETSNNYQGYKVVDYEELVSLKNRTNQYIQQLKDEITVQKNTEDQQAEQIEKLNEKLESTEAELEKVNAEKDAIEFLGMPFSKGSYMALMWGIVGLLVAALLIFIYKFKNSNATTKEANKRLKETEAEFDAYRAKSLEKEQKLGRMLQDEKNKNNS
ncbi:hypothetical protein [Salegentibacter chungangensis]|uniref:tRNA (Guanine-N1)-methyltransferase n=1 Tax=Salegentibacter chungangensis TaxID=1335724 RepID=A0ABW3NX71_9FLAO